MNSYPVPREWPFEFGKDDVPYAYGPSREGPDGQECHSTPPARGDVPDDPLDFVPKRGK